MRFLVAVLLVAGPPLAAVGADPRVRPMAFQTERLTDAVIGGQPAPVQRLIAAGANVNEPDDTGMTPIMIAAAEGHAPIVRLLTAAGADGPREVPGAALV